MTLKKAKITSSLINLSKNERVSGAIKSKIVRIIKYLSQEEFLDSWKSSSTIQYKDLGKLDDLIRMDEPNYLLNDQEKFEVFSKGNKDHQDHIKETNHRPNSRRLQQIAQQSLYDSSSTGLPPRSRGNNSSAYEAPKPGYRDKTVTFGEPQDQALDAFGEPIKRNTYKGGVFADNFELDGQNNNSEHLYLEYLSLLDSSNSQELISYGVQNLAPMIDDCIYTILNSKSSYLKLLNLIELNLTSEDKVRQKKILNCLARNLTEDRARDGINSQIIERILKYFNRQGTDFHDVFTALIFAHIKQSNYQIKVNGLIEMLKSPFINLQDLSLKVLREISSPTLQIPGSNFGQNEQNQSFNIQFENHLRYLLEQSLSKDRSLQ